MDVVEIARELIAIPSENPMGNPDKKPAAAEQELTRYLVDFMIDFKIPFEIQQVTPGRCNVLAMIKGESNDEVILLDAHQDTVPADQMTIEPFEGTVSDGRLYGRGACDVKGGMAAILVALEEMLHMKRRATVIASFTCDEEHQQIGAEKLVRGWRHSAAAERISSIKPDMAIITEPTELNVVVAHRGVVRWTISTSGRTAHSSRPDQGCNAIYRMAAVVQVLEDYASQLGALVPVDPLCGQATLSVGVIRGGTSVNVVPDLCEIEVDRRLLPGESAEQAQADVMKRLADQLDFDVTASEPWCLSDPLENVANKELAFWVGDWARELAGKGDPIGVSYGTHAPHFAQAGVPTVVFGPGNILQAHTEDEWVDISQLNLAVDILIDVCSNR